MIIVDCLHKILDDLEFQRKLSDHSTVDCLHKILDDLEFQRKLSDHSTVDCLHKILESNNSVDFTVI